MSDFQIGSLGTREIPEGTNICFNTINPAPEDSEVAVLRQFDLRPFTSVTILEDKPWVPIWVKMYHEHKKTGFLPSKNFFKVLVVSHETPHVCYMSLDDLEKFNWVTSTCP